MERPDFIDPNTEFTYISEGKRSNVFDIGDYAVKVLKKHDNSGDIHDLALDFKQEYLLLKNHLGDYVVNTDFVIGSQDGMPSVYVIQPDIHGVPLADLTDTQLKSPLIIDFFKKSLDLYHDTGMIPDLFGRPILHPNLYTKPNTTPNVIVSNIDNLPFPNLVDILFTRTSKKPVIGAVHQKILARGIEKFLDKLEN